MKAAISAKDNSAEEEKDKLEKRDNLLKALGAIKDLSFWQKASEADKELVEAAIQMVSSDTINHLDQIALGTKIALIHELLYAQSKFAITNSFSPSPVNQILLDLKKHLELYNENHKSPEVVRFKIKESNTQAHQGITDDIVYVYGTSCKVASNATNTFKNFVGWSSCTGSLSTKIEKPVPITPALLNDAISKLRKVGG